MRLRKPLLAHVLLLFSLLGAFWFLNYRPIFYLPFETLAQVCVLALFGWLGLATRADARWVWYVFVPGLLLSLFILLYAYVFHLRSDAPLRPSILAQRYYLFALLGPIVFMLRIRGWKLADFLRIFVLAAATSFLSWAVFDLTKAPHSVLLSGKFFVLDLKVFSPGYGGLLRSLNGMVLFLLLYFGRRALQPTRPLVSAFSIVMLVSASAFLIITWPRTLIASAIAALVLYAVFVWRPNLATLSAATLPLWIPVIALSTPIIRGAFVGTFGTDESYRTRTKEAKEAWQLFLDHPLLGYGQDSNQWISFNHLFGYMYPADIGLLGVAFQFGLLGLFLYLIFSGWLSVNLARLVQRVDADVPPRNKAFLWALLITSLTFVLTSPLQARFIFPTFGGVPIAAFVWGLLIAYKHGEPRKSLSLPTSSKHQHVAQLSRAKPL